MRLGLHSAVVVFYGRPVLWKNCADDDAAAGTGIEVDQDDLLILAGEEFSLGERNGDAGADEGGADVRVAVVVVPGGFVFVAIVVGDEALEDIGNVVFHEAVFIFKGGNGCGAADDEKINDSVTFSDQAAAQLG